MLTTATATVTTATATVTTATYDVDIDSCCTGQEFHVKRSLCFITGKPITMVDGMGLFQSYIGQDASDETCIRGMLSSVNVVPMAIRLCA